MRYIHVNQRDLQVSLRSRLPKGSYMIPVEKGKHDVLERSFHGLVYHNILYPYRQKQDQISGISGIKYSLVEPDPWLVAVCAIMWQGLLQGMTWDGIEYAVQRGLSFLRMQNLAPTEQAKPNGSRGKRVVKKSALEMGFRWTQFATDGKAMRELFLGVRREFGKKTETEREYIKGQYKKLFVSTDRNEKMKGNVKKSNKVQKKKRITNRWS